MARKPAKSKAIMTNQEADRILEQAFSEQLTEKAQSYALDAVDVLHNVMKDPETAAPARISAARGILEYAVGKPAAPIAVPSGMSLSVTINKLVTGTKTERFLAAGEGTEVAEALAVARQFVGPDA